MKTKEIIYEILKEILPNELEDYFGIEDENTISDFVHDVLNDIEDNLD